jgi:phage shock protein B
MGSLFLTAVTIFLIPVMALAVLGGLVVLLVRILGGNKSRYSRYQKEEETRLIQEIYQGLSKMEKRIEALETILLNSEGKEKDAEDS